MIGLRVGREEGSPREWAQMGADSGAGSKDRWVFLESYCIYPHLLRKETQLVQDYKGMSHLGTYC